MGAPLELLDMNRVKVDPKWALEIPANLAVRKQVLPFTERDGHVLVACQDPSDSQSLQAIERYVHMPVMGWPAEPESLERVIQRIFQDVPGRNANAATPIRTVVPATGGEESDADNAVALTDEIFRAALIRQATDIHIEPYARQLSIRLRVDGLLEEYRQLPISIHPSLISRLKVLAGLDIAERRAPQDGRYSLPLDQEREIDVRVATMPTKHGERMTLRLLAIHDAPLGLDDLGMQPGDYDRFLSTLDRPNGLVLVTGPTGCGKSTTLYAALRYLIARRPLNVITIEDPVESLIHGVSQVEVDVNDKVSFHKALRGVLRHDPDVLMIGEIRDEETAETAIKAALTGHLVFTTLHANSATSCVTRLVDMGVRPFLVGAVMRAAVGQRLVRRLCERCRTTVELTADQARLLGREALAGHAVFQPVGCHYCAGSGFFGRIGLFEFFFSDPELARQIAERPSELELDRVLAQRGVHSLLDDGIEKMKAGLTTFDEVASVVNPCQA